MILNKKDLKKLPNHLISKVNEIVSDIYSNTKPLNIDRDVRSTKINDQYRLLYRNSTKKEVRLLTHNDYNRLIKFNCIVNVK